jgi:hypothetical protein
MQGEMEKELVRMIGFGGYDVLERIAELNAVHLARLCEANYYGMVGNREIQAAIYAAKQMPRRRRTLR